MARKAVDECLFCGESPCVCGGPKPKRKSKRHSRAVPADDRKLDNTGDRGADLVPVKRNDTRTRKADGPKASDSEVQSILLDEAPVKRKPRSTGTDLATFRAIRALADAGILHTDECSKRPDNTGRTDPTGALLGYLEGGDSNEDA